MKSELDTFDGLDNRKEVMVLLQRLGSDSARAAFLCQLTKHSSNGFAGSPVQVVNHCDSVTAYFMMVSICNELGVSINYAAKKLDHLIRNGGYQDTPPAIVDTTIYRTMRPRTRGLILG